MLAVIAFVTAQSDLNDQATAAVLAASVTGAVTVFVAGFGLVNRRDERSDRLTIRQQDIGERADIRKEEAVFRAFEYFTGKTQRRNVGISIVEHYWDETPDLRGMFVALLANQATYLLEESDQTDKAHERSNLGRVMAMLIRAADEGIGSPNDFADVMKSIARRKGPREPDAKGVDVDPQELTRWEAGLAGARRG